MKTSRLTTLLLLTLLSLGAQAQVQINYGYDANGNRIARQLQPYPDLTPIFYVRPFFVNGQSPISAVVQLLELNNLPTNGPITLYLTKQQHITLALDPSLTNLQGRAVHNSLWSLDATSNPNYYKLTSTSSVAGGGMLGVGLTGTLSPNGSSGRISLSALLLGSGGEINLTNNADSEIIDYTP